VGRHCLWFAIPWLHDIPGFTKTACIVFEVHIRVDEEDAPKRPAGATPIRLGSAEGWQSIRGDGGPNAGVTNVRALFSFNRSNVVEDGEILLIAPSTHLVKARAAYDAFLNSMKFGQ
jgi:hypothetical protein